MINKDKENMLHRLITYSIPLFVCTVIILSSCGQSKKIAKTGDSVAESEAILAKRRKKEQKEALKQAKLVNKNHWDRQSKEVKKSIKRNQKKMKKNKKQKGRFIP